MSALVGPGGAPPPSWVSFKLVPGGAPGPWGPPAEFPFSLGQLSHILATCPC